MILFFAFILLISFFLAKLEIQIEGKHGYAAKLPCAWRTKNKWAVRFGITTSYHFYLNLFLISMIHMPFAVGLRWTLGAELTVLSFFLFLQLTEDFLWFVLNPHYGIRKFNKASIPWFPHWFLGLPTWYYQNLLIGASLFILSRIV